MENNWLERFRAEYKPLLKDKYDEFEYGLACPKSKHIRIQSSRNIDYLKDGIVYEIKKSKAEKEMSVAQIKYYLWFPSC